MLGLLVHGLRYRALSKRSFVASCFSTIAGMPDIILERLQSPSCTIAKVIECTAYKL